MSETYHLVKKEIDIYIKAIAQCIPNKKVKGTVCKWAGPFLRLQVPVKSLNCTLVFSVDPRFPLFSGSGSAPSLLIKILILPWRPVQMVLPKEGVWDFPWGFLLLPPSACGLPWTLDCPPYPVGESVLLTGGFPLTHCHGCLALCPAHIGHPFKASQLRPSRALCESVRVQQ
jgi:hypothetical protein